MKKSKSRGPLKASEAEGVRCAAIPETVFEVFNEFITQKLSGGEARILQNDVVKVLVRRMKVKRETIFDNHWLDVESAYRKAGWIVEYDKPGYNESYEAFFLFRRRSGR